MLEEVKNDATRSLVLASLRRAGPKGMKFSDFFLDYGLEPAFLKRTLFGLQLEGLVEEAKPNFYRLAEGKPPATAAEKKETESRLFVCPYCGLTYEEEIWARRCEVWCGEHGSCNADIGRHSLEGQGKQKHRKEREGLEMEITGPSVEMTEETEESPLISKIAPSSWLREQMRRKAGVKGRKRKRPGR